MCLLKGDARMADGNGHEFHLPPYCLEGGDERYLLVGIFLEPPVTSEVLAESETANLRGVAYGTYRIIVLIQ